MPRWYFTSPEPCRSSPVLRALELAEELTVCLPGDVGEHVEPAAVRHADRHLVEAGAHRCLEIVSRSGMVVSPPSRLKRFCPTYLVCRNVSNASASLSLLEDAAAACRVEGFRTAAPPCSWIQACCCRIRDVHVLDAGCAAVRVAQHARGCRAAGRASSAEPARDELAVEIPEGQAVAADLEVGMRALLVLERVDVGHQVAPHAERVDRVPARARSCRASRPGRPRCPRPSGSGRRGSRSAAKMSS